jgi:hypothetical protein
VPDMITTAFVQDYKSTIDLLLQQSGSRFRSAVTTDSYRGKAGKAVEQFGPAVAQKRTARNSDTPILNVPQDARWVFPVDYEWGSLIDDQDKLRMLVDPTSAYAQNGANAMARAQDDEILAAFFATSLVGENGTGTEAFDTTNYQVGVNVGGTASALNVAKLQSALQKLMLANKGEINEPVYCAISSYEHDALLKEIQVTSMDYSNQAVLENGRVRRFMGFEFIITERLGITGGNRLIPAWVKSGMHLGMWEDINAQISPRADKGYATQVYLRGTWGATRLMQGKVVQILCDDQI